MSEQTNDLSQARHGWETFLSEAYDKSCAGYPGLVVRAQWQGLDGGLSLGISLAGAFAIMRGMQDTIDELRSRLAAVEKKR